MNGSPVAYVISSSVFSFVRNCCEDSCAHRRPQPHGYTGGAANALQRHGERSLSAALPQSLASAIFAV